MERSLGAIKVSTPGTPVIVTNNQSDPNARFVCHAYFVQALPTNVGKVYVGRLGMNKTTLAGVFGILSIPTANFIPSFSATMGNAPAGLNMVNVYVDADSANDGVLVTALVS